MTTQTVIQEAAGAFNVRECTIANTKFRISKLLPRRGFEVLEMIRFAVGPRLSSIKVDDENAFASIVVGVLLSIPPADFERIERALYEGVEFQRQGSSFVALNEDTMPMAFEDFEPVQIYELVARCLSRNFFGSLDAALSRMAEIMQTSSPPSSET